MARYLGPNPSGRTAQGVGLRPLACWDCGFESPLGHGCLSLVSVVCCHVDISATGRSLVQRSPTECGVSACDLDTSKMTTPRSIRADEPEKNCFWLTTGMRLCSVELIYCQRYDFVTCFKLNKQKGTLAMVQAQEHDFVNCTFMWPGIFIDFL